MEKQPSNNSALAPEVTGGVDYSLDDLFESTSASHQPESDSSDIWGETSTAARPAETDVTDSPWDEVSTWRPAETSDSLWGESITPTPTPLQELGAVDSFSSEQFVSPEPSQETGGSLIQRIRNAASKENLGSALERITEVASALGGMAVEASVSAAGVAKGKAGEAIDATREFIADEENQEAGKRFVKAGVKIAKDGAFGEIGLDILKSDGSIKKGKAVRLALRAARNPGVVAAIAGKGMFQQGRKQTTALGIDLVKNRFA